MTWTEETVAALNHHAKVGEWMQARADAWKFVEAWLDDDEELRIPGNDFGRELNHSVRLLIDTYKKKDMQ